MVIALCSAKVETTNIFTVLNIRLSSWIKDNTDQHLTCARWPKLMLPPNSPRSRCYNCSHFVFEETEALAQNHTAGKW